MDGLKVCVIGAGSTYTPELIDGFIKRKKEMPIARMSLMDIDEHKLNIVGNLAIRMAEKSHLGAEIDLTTDRKKAIEGANFILTQIRVGGIPARIRDEHIPLEFGVIGQETTGPGGFAKALRTIPVILDIARDIEKLGTQRLANQFYKPKWDYNRDTAKALKSECYRLMQRANRNDKKPFRQVRMPAGRYPFDLCWLEPPELGYPDMRPRQ